MGYITGENREQLTMFPEAVDDYITADNPVRFIEAFVDELDIEKLEFRRAEPKELGRPGYDPRDLLKLYLYGYLNRIRTSRRLEVEAGRNLELIWLMRKLKPDFKTIADFRKDNAKPLKKIIQEFQLICQKLELFGGELIAVDGSKFRASNSKKRNFNALKLKKLIQKIDENIEGYLKELDKGDAGDKNDRDSKEELKKKIEKMRELRAKHKETEEKLEASGESQISLTDPDARLMRTTHGTYVGYNVQMAVDSKHKMIAVLDTTNDINDEHQLSNITGQAKEALGVTKIVAVADLGYYNCDQVKKSEENGITAHIGKPRVAVIEGVFGKERFEYNSEKDVYVCPAGKELRYRATNNKERVKLYTTTECKSCEMKPICTRAKGSRQIKRHINENVMEEMAKRVKEEPDKLKSRGSLVEHPWGTIKRAFDQGYFLMRGIEKVNAEIALTGVVYNMKRAFNIIGVPKLIEALG